MRETGTGAGTCLVSNSTCSSQVAHALWLQTTVVMARQEYDPYLILTKTRWQNRRAIKCLNQCFARLKVKQHPDKTFIGKIERGFDFLGYHFSREPLKLARNTVKKHVKHIYRLYEQQITKKATSEEVAFVLGNYVKRWQCWCTPGLGSISLAFVYGELHRNLEVLSP